MRIALIGLCVLFLGCATVSQGPSVTLSSQGHTECVIVLSADALPSQQHAAEELASFLNQVTGAKFEIRPPDKAGDGPKIAVGPEAALQLAPDLDLSGLGEEGIVIQTLPPHIILTGGPGAPRGTLYAVYTFLEDVVGCRWWTSKASTIPRTPTLEIPSLNVRYVPVFKVREPFYRNAFTDKVWQVRNKNNGSHPVQDPKHGGHVRYQGFVHTFSRLVPPDKHFKEHPEWYSLIDGKRESEDTQLCLTNEQMKAVLIEQVKEWLKMAPDAKFLSVSPDDSRIVKSYRCECPRCAEAERQEGSPAGLLLRFVNDVAQAVEKDYPNVQITTLAYHYTRKPPRITKPRHNVAIVLCPIENSYAKPMDHPKNRDFQEDFAGWIRICKHVHIWEYVTNFRHFIMPHPNLYVLGPNIRYYARQGAEAVFSQGNQKSLGGEMSELRAWVLSKLMWNPTLDDRKLIREFLAGYYEEAAPFIEKYVDLMHEQVRATDSFLHCYTYETDPFLTPDAVFQAEDIFREAEAAVGKKPEVLSRVKAAHLAIWYVAILRWDEFRKAAGDTGRDWPYPEKRADLVSKFVEICKRNQITCVAESPGMTIEWFEKEYGK